MATKQDPRTLQCAVDGFQGVPYDARAHGLLTSTNHAAYCVGEWMRESGRTMPQEVRPSRGDTMHVNGMLVRLDWRNVKFPTITRER
jgi:hypothetical protein